MEYPNYKDFINYLKTFQDLKYKEFNRKLSFTKYEMIGIRVPILRKIAKEILKGDYKKFLNSVNNKYYEEVFIEGLVIASLSEDEILNYLPKYILKIDDWSICDSFCNSLKFIKNDYQKYFGDFKKLLFSNEEFVVRVGLVILINYYIKEEYINEIFSLIDQINVDKYYVNMAIAWLLTEMYINYPDQTIKYLECAQINDFTFNKTLSKISDSYRVTKEEKELLRKMKR